jgi:phenylacetate-CoA ligase
MAISEMFSLDEIAILQTRQLRKTIHYIYNRSPFYRDLLDREGMSLTDIKTLEDLRHLPTTSKEDLSREGERFLCVRPEEVADITTTSGTSGAPIFFKLTEDDLARLAYNEQLSFRLAGITEKDMVALAVTLDRCFMAGMAYYMGLRRLGAAVLRVGPISPAFLLRFLERTGATAVVSVPSFLKRVGMYAEETGISLRHSTVRKLICIGEPIRQADFSLNALGQALSRSWGAQLFSTYASTEMSTTFGECEFGCGGHLHPELMHVEIVDENGRPVPNGAMGEVCVTPFGVTGMPLLRYRTGDFSCMHTEVCACGRNTLRLGPILGRRGQMLKVRGTTVFPAGIHEIVQAEAEVRAHVLIVESEDALSDKLTLLLDTDQPRAAERVRERVQAEIKTAPAIRIVSAEEINRLQSEGEYRKRRIFIDRRPTSQ